MITKKHIVAAMLAAPATLLFAAPAQAQVNGIAYANPTTVVGNSKAFAAANAQIATTYKTAFDQIKARRDALQKESEPIATQIRTQFDTDKDGQLNQAEQTALQNSKSPLLDRLKTIQTTAETDVARLTNPAARAELFAIESILRQYEAAQMRVVTARKVGVVLSPEVFMYAPESADISPAITAELDKAVPSVSIAPPADWQPARETLAIQQQLIQLQQARAYQAQAAQQGARPAGAAPAPAGARPAAPAPAKPAEPR